MPNPIDVAALSENDRVAYLVDMDRALKNIKMERSYVASYVRHDMLQNGVLRAVYPSAVVYLTPAKFWQTPSARRLERARFGCNLQGRRDPYLVVIPTGDDDAA